MRDGYELEDNIYIVKNIITEKYKYMLRYYNKNNLWGKLRMKNPILKTSLVIFLSFLLVSTCVISGKRSQDVNSQVIISKQNTDETAIIRNQDVKTFKGQQSRYFAISNDPKKALTINDVYESQDKYFPRIISQRKTFIIYLEYEQIRDKFALSLHDFNWDEEMNRYIFDMGEETHEFQWRGSAFAELSDLEIFYDFDIPYTISYSYKIQTYPLQSAPFGSFMKCRVYSSPMQVEPGLYLATETYNGESAFESYEDLDGQVIKRALGYEEGNLTKSMAYFKVNSENYAEDSYVYQRGLNYLSAICGDGKKPTGGASIGAYARTMGFDILGDMDLFWIDSGWEGTIGDRYISNQKFRIEPR